ncbi:hypothetical protein [Pseudotamlana carrageenivorans]|uniref:Uncharacterized protein n=1 Tax=Pseudotamlana carrageenivorans TaxID=2069432 RepID=A0A2I7SHF2_9FLAO|nr:hypothetical protein [Tamlana carrageenivorans]AUS05333.1 hypothetical protein C1A40_07520 [Tamlana carrageenivorans]
MNNLLGNKKKEIGFYENPNLKAFSKTLNTEQLEAMVHVFFLVVTADEFALNLRMYNYIHDQFNALGFDIKKAYVHKYASKADIEAYGVLANMSHEQKKWFEIALHTMLYDIHVSPTNKQIEQYNIICDKALNIHVSQAIH